jgi:hypothetical protein
MLTANDIKHLKRSQTKGGKIGIWALPVIACVLIVGGVLNIHLGSKLAAMQSVGFGEVTRFQLGITGFVYGVLVAVVSYFYAQSIRRNQRILKFIEDQLQETHAG